MVYYLSTQIFVNESEIKKICLKSESVQFNLECSSIPIHQLTLESDTPFQEQLLVQNFKHFSSRILVSLDASKNQEVIEYECAQGLPLKVPICSQDRTGVLHYFKKLSSRFSVEQITLINRDFYLRHKDNFGKRLSAILSYPELYKQSEMFIFFLSDLINPSYSVIFFFVSIVLPAFATFRSTLPNPNVFL